MLNKLIDIPIDNTDKNNLQNDNKSKSQKNKIV